jgi:MerR family redox-sensitive transcriptional activator SoxR
MTAASPVKPIALLTIGALAKRTGLSVSAIRFYESRGIVAPLRNAGGQRRFLRSDIRRLSFVLIAQRLGLTISAIQALLAGLPQQRTPTQRDWQAIAKRLQDELDARIEMLVRTRNNLAGCIGCGCLSLKRCHIYNPEDRIAAQGPGPRLVLIDPVEDA